MSSQETGLVELQRRAALGTLCAAIAHEVHGPLDCAAVVLRQALQRARGAPGHPQDAVLTGELGVALEGVSLARAVLSDAMALAAPAEPMGTTDLSRDVDAVLTLAAAVKPGAVQVVPALEPGLRVLGSRTHVQQIVLNLLLNAFRALEAGGEREDGLVRLTTSAVGSSTARLVVEDNGPGIPDGLRQRLFQAFAGSRGTGDGPGLGLHVVKRITDMLGGSVAVESRHGQGTAVVVELPLAD